MKQVQVFHIELRSLERLIRIGTDPVLESIVKVDPLVIVFIQPMEPFLDRSTWFL